MLDGVYARAVDGGLRFHPAPEPAALDVANILTTIVASARRVLGECSGGTASTMKIMHTIPNEADAARPKRRFLQPGTQNPGHQPHTLKTLDIQS